METMHPVVLRGRTELALPLEEFAARLVSTQRALAERGLDALVVHGDARDYAPLAWITGLVPMLKWAVAIVPAAGGAELYLAMPGTRDLPAMRKLAAVAAVDGIAALGAALSRFDRVALVGARRMRAGQEAAIRANACVVDDGDALFADLTAAVSPRELELLRTSAALAEEAAEVVAESWLGGARAGAALLDGDLLARELGAHDVRVLWSHDGGRSFRPLLRPEASRPEPFAFYLAVECGGYWGEAFRTLEALPDEPLAPHPLVARTARLWLAIEESDGEPSRPGVYSLRRTTASGAVTSRTVEIS